MKEKIFVLFLILISLVFINCEDTGDNTEDSTPYIVESFPENNAVGVPVNLKIIAIRFNESMNGGSSHNTTFSTTSVHSDWEWYEDDENCVFLIGVGETLAANTIYSVTLNPEGSDLYYEDLEGNKLATDTVITFTTGGAGTLAPTISTSTPADGDIDIAIDTSIFTINFSDIMVNGISFNHNFNLSDGDAYWNTTQQLYIEITNYGSLDNSKVYGITMNPFGHNFNFNNGTLPVNPYTKIFFTTVDP